MTVIKKDFDILLSAVFALICFTLNFKKKSYSIFFYDSSSKLSCQAFMASSAILQWPRFINNINMLKTHII